MFRLQNNTPQYYIEESRDFQLFCRLYDFINNGVIFDIQTMKNILDPLKMNDRILNLLATKIGFFPQIDIDSKLLRYILAAFPFFIKYKGSKKAIEAAVSAIIKVEGTDVNYRVIIINENKESPELSYTINIYTTQRLINKKALEEVLKYIIPIGYTYRIQEFEYRTYDPTQASTLNKLSYLINPSVSTSQIIGNDRVEQNTRINSFDFLTNMEAKHIGTYDVTQIVGSTDLSSDEYTECIVDNKTILRNNIDLSTNPNNPSEQAETVIVKEDI